MKKILIGASVATLLLIGVPVVAPRLVNWNDYRDELAARVGDAIGQSVRFDGDLGLQLLPAPAFTAQNVRIKAPRGFTQEDMATIKHLEVRIALSSLLSGRVAVESLAVAEPSVVVETDAAGRINWRSAARGGGGGGGGDAVGPLGRLFSFDQILLRNGLLTLIDSRSGVRETLTKIDLKITAGSLTGPFQIAGGLTLRGAPLRLDATTGRFANGAAAPVRLAVTLPGGDPERLSGARFAGIISPDGPAPQVQGELRLEGPNLKAALAPALTPVGDGGALSDRFARPFSLRATVEAASRSVRFDNLEIVLGDAKAAGAAALALNDDAVLSLSLLTGRLELDSWLPTPNADAPPAAPPRRVAPRSAANPLAANPLAANPPAASSPAAASPTPNSSAAAFLWPEKLRAEIDLTVDAAAYAGGVIRQARLIARADKTGVAVDRLSMLPPGGAFAANGRVSFADGAPEADLLLDATADNLRALLGWLKADLAGAPADRLRSAAFAGRIKASADRLEVADAEISLDAVKAKGALLAEWRARPAFGLRLESAAVNIDDYLSGPAAPAPANPPAPTPAPPLTAPAGGRAAPLSASGGMDFWDGAAARLLSRGDAALDVRLGALTFGGRVWRDVTLDVAAAGGALDLRRFEAEAADGGKLRLSGQAERFSPLSGAHLTVEASTPDAAALLPLAVKTLPAAAPALTNGPAALRARLAGDRDKLALEATLEAAGGKLEAGGEAFKPLALLGLTPGNGGRFDLTARLSHPDADAALAPFGWRAPAAPGPLDVYAKLTGDATRLTVADLKGALGDAPVAGSLKLDRKPARPWIEADLQTGPLDFDRLQPATAKDVKENGAKTAAATAPAGENARPASADLDALRRFDGRFALTAAGLTASGVKLDNVAAKLQLADGALSVERFDAGLAGGRIGGRATLSAAAPGKPPRLSVSATAEGMKPTGAYAVGPLSLTGGVADAEAELLFVDPAAPDPLRRLSGTARLSSRGGSLRGADLTVLRDRLRQADRPQALLEGVARGLQGGETAVTTLDGSARIENGVAETADARMETAAGGVGAVGKIDLAARLIDMLVTVEPDLDPPVPPLALRLTGSLDQPTRSLDLSALQRHLAERLGGNAATEALKNAVPRPSGGLPGALEAPARDVLRNLLR